MKNSRLWLIALGLAAGVLSGLPSPATQAQKPLLSESDCSRIKESITSYDGSGISDRQREDLILELDEFCKGNSNLLLG